MDPSPTLDRPPVNVTPPPEKKPVLPATEAYRRGLMPLASTGVWAYRQAHPDFDGRGVIIGIMDSGIDAGIAGLTTTSTGERKLLDLRDFSGEGSVPLAPVTPKGDLVTIDGITLGGFRRVAALNATGPYYAGIFKELPLGEPPASDVNGNGTNTDRLPVIVTKASDGWVLFVDANGNGSLDDEQGIHDFQSSKETFGWSVSSRPSPLTMAVNLTAPETDGAPPRLDLFFDNSGHGTHVAGIAAGFGMYGVAGFDGVAPGAHLLGLKIANNAHGGISVTGSMIKALAYAIQYAETRNVPLVINMSFGVGNEKEGAARIDALIDSVLVAHPNVIFTTSAGNDGPGISTMGFPGSANRVITVGATYPGSFLAPQAGAVGDVIAFFSSRGGELAKPDLVAPGIAYSTVPRWDTGSEDKSGTSMAAPHVAGAVALLVSAARQEKRTITSEQVKHAMVATARPLAGATFLDQGAGLLDLVAADRVLRAFPPSAASRVRNAAFIVSETAAVRDTTVSILLDGGLPGAVRLVSDQEWLEVPSSLQLTPPKSTLAVMVRGAGVTEPGIHVGTVVGWARDTTIGPIFQAVVSVVRPVAPADSGATERFTLRRSSVARLFLRADSARPFRVTTTAGAGQHLLAFLYQPGGEPNRGENGLPGGSGQEAAVYEVDGRDVLPGVYEAVSVAPPADSASAQVHVAWSPVAFRAVRTTSKDTVVATVVGMAGGSTSGSVALGLVGAERTLAIPGRGSAERSIPFRVPAWAKRIVVDLTLERDQWPLFTDFGFTLYGPDGQILGKEPMNYHFGRLSVDVPAAARNQDVSIVLSPGFADPDANTLWSGNLSIRLYAETPVLLDPAGPAEFSLKRGAQSAARFLMSKMPWPLGDAFFPLGQMVIDVGGTTWGREIPLPEPKLALTR
jgi:subtilisin family serine protease